jgi:hypothetical protein
MAMAKMATIRAIALIMKNKKINIKGGSDDKKRFSNVGIGGSLCVYFLSLGLGSTGHPEP